MAITKDFVTRYGVLIQGNTAVTSSTAQTNALQVNGGAAIAKNLIVGTTADIYGPIIGRNSISIFGPAQINGQFTATGNSFFQQNLTVTGGLLVTGPTTLTNTLNVTGPTTFVNSSTFNGNLISNGTSIFNGPVQFSDGGTLAFSTGSLTLSGFLTVGGIGTFNSTTVAAAGGIGALVVPNGGLYVGNNLYLAGTNANTGTKTSNALYLAGGAWIDKSLVVEGETLFKGPVTFNGTATYVYSTNTYYTDNIINVHVPPDGVNGAWTIDDGKDIGLVFHNYKGADNDSFLGWANDTGYLEWYGTGLEVSGTFTNATYGIFKTGGIRLTTTETAISASTGALQSAGGVSAKNIWTTNDISGGTLTARNLTQGRIVFAGVGGQLTDDAELTYDALTNLLSADVSKATTATNLAGGGPGMVPYQADVGVTAFVATGTSGFVLSSNGASAPSWIPLSGVVAGNANTATNIAGGTANQLVIQTAPSSTGFVGPGNAGQFLRSNGSSSPPSYVNTGNMYVGYAIWADNLKGAANGIPYQAGVDTTQFIIPGTIGTLLQSNGTTATFVSTSSIQVGYATYANQWTTPRTITLSGGATGFVTIDGSADAVLTATIISSGATNTATNLANGTTGAIPYQSAPSLTTFLTLSGTENSILAAGTSAPKYVTQVQVTSGTGSATSATVQSLRVTAGGAGIVGDSYFTNSVGIGSTLTIGLTTSSMVVPAIYSNNVVLASYTSPTITGTGSVNLDQFKQSEYRTARYTVQIVDGSNIHVTEIIVTHNGTDAYINEYGIVTNNGELGTFNATADGTNVTLTFNVTTVSSMVIKVVRFGISS